ncbi:MAG: hypothetical protein MUE94_08755 [Verrucomicrobia bacterium]|jgi:hypothetical protein|nr:hypothetical protein [Verrucomicrobiota bacterium]
MKLAMAHSGQAWQPFTPAGVAAFAVASAGRLALVQGVFAALAGVAVTSFLVSAWFPTISEATRKLPEQGYVRAGRLVWTGPPSVVLASSPWLAITVDVKNVQTYRLPTDLQVEFSEHSVRFLSLAGFLDVPYPTAWIIVFNEPELGAWWNAWAPFLAAGAGVATAGGLILLWTIVGWVYAIPARTLCWFVGQDLSLSAVWRVGIAAHLPGAVLMSFTLLLYSLRGLDLVPWLLGVGAQIPLGWLYLFLAIFFLPSPSRHRARSRNPFSR